MYDCMTPRTERYVRLLIFAMEKGSTLAHKKNGINVIHSYKILKALGRKAFGGMTFVWPQV